MLTSYREARRESRRAVAVQESREPPRIPLAIIPIISLLPRRPASPRAASGNLVCRTTGPCRQHSTYSMQKYDTHTWRADDILNIHTYSTYVLRTASECACGQAGRQEENMAIRESFLCQCGLGGESATHDPTCQGRAQLRRDTRTLGPWTSFFSWVETFEAGR